MWTFRGIGYRTRFDSSAYPNETRDRDVFFDTTSNGIPIGPPSHLPEPKSACTGEPSPIDLISSAESADTGSLSTFWFHGLFAGKTGQRRAAGSRSACADEPVSRAIASAIARAAAVARRFISISSAGTVLILSAVGRAPSRRVLVVDDDDDIRLLLEELLRGAGYGVVTATDGRAALRTFHADPTDLIVLDLSMPELDGFETLERLRDLSDVPVILLTARAGEIDKVRGFRGGADDYVVKPFGRQELLARIEALLRRAPQSTHQEHYDDGTLSIDYGRRLVMCRGLPVSLTPLEFRLLVTFVEHGGQVLSADQLIEHVWGHAGGVSRDQVKLYVSYLRKKLGQEADGYAPIETVRGFGYRYVPPAA